jgi:hypothetical protein
VQIHDHTEYYAAAEAASTSTTAMGAGILTPKSCTDNPSDPLTNGSTSKRVSRAGISVD